MRSTIYLADTITNADRTFGSADAYVPVTVIDDAGATDIALLTPARIREGIERGQRNPEDLNRVQAAQRLRERVEAATASMAVRRAFGVGALIGVALAGAVALLR